MKRTILSLLFAFFMGFGAVACDDDTGGDPDGGTDVVEDMTDDSDDAS